MFERYTEKARRTIFFARYEASQFGSPYIETEHLLLGLLREDKALTNRFLRGPGVVEDIRRQIESATTVREKTSTSVDLPLSNENKRVLAYAAEEAERLSHKHIGTEHLLLGLLREEKSFGAQILLDLGLRISSIREELARSAHEGEAAPQAKETGLLADFSTYLTRLAKEGSLLPCVGREREIEQVIHILGRSSKNNAVLVGDPGVGKRTIAEGVVQRVANNMGPTFLQEKLFAALDLATVITAAQHSTHAREFLQAANTELVAWGANTIFVFDELHMLLAAGTDGGAQEVALLLKAALLDGKVRCIALATSEDYRAAVKKARWLDRCFHAVEVQPPSEAEAIKILQGIKGRFEKFHSVQYAEEALAAAVTYSSRHVKNRSLPDKAIDLMDDAGAYVKMEQEAGVLPADVIENRKRISFIQRRQSNAIANHEFEKARFYGDEERKEKAALQELEKKYNIRTDLVGTVTAAHVEEALARWTGMPVAAIREAPAAADIATEKQNAEQAEGRKKQKKKKSS